MRQHVRAVCAIVMTAMLFGSRACHAGQDVSHVASAPGFFGQTYTLKTGVDFTVVSAEYTVKRVPLSPGQVAYPKADEKLFVLHLKLKNAGATDTPWDPAAHKWTAVDEDGDEHPAAGYGHFATGQPLEPKLPAGQEWADTYAYIVLPSRAQISKLILGAGIKDQTNDVIDFDMSERKNGTTPLPRFVNDTGDPSGVCSLPKVIGVAGIYYPMGLFDVSFDKAVYSKTPINGNPPDTDKRYLMITLTFRNESGATTPICAATFDAKVTDGDDQDYPCDGALRPVTNEDVPIDHTSMALADYKMRYYVQVPKTTPIATFTISEAGSREYKWDLSMLR